MAKRTPRPRADKQIPDADDLPNEDDNEDYDAADIGWATVDPDVAEALYLAACARAAEAGL